MVGESEPEGPEVCDQFCAICRPSRRPWDWDGPYQTYRWSRHLVEYPDRLVIPCDAAGCENQAVRSDDYPYPDSIPAMRLRAIQRELVEQGGWYCDRNVNLCPDHSPVAAG